MARASGSASSSSGGGRRGRTPDEARLIQRLKRLAPQQKALAVALRRLTEDGELPTKQAFVDAFEDNDAETIASVKSVTGLYEGLVNHLVEMLHLAAKMRGLSVTMTDQRPTGPELFRAVAADGGLTDNQVEVLTRLYGVRNELQHVSPGVDGNEVYSAIDLLQKTLKRFVQTYISWLRSHDIDLMR